MISQFVSSHKQRLLGDLDYIFPEGTNAVGRLDDHSEGLLILTTDKTLTKRLLHPDRKHKRNYVVQVERIITDESIQKLRNGIPILVKRKGIYLTLPCEVNRIEKPLNLPLREKPLKDFIPQSWIEFILIEGKNRQIRKMCTSVRHNCKRLIRTKIENLELGNMLPGEVVEIEKEKLFNLLLIHEGV